MGTPVEAVLFDVDDTLCEYERTSGELLALAFDDVGVDPFLTPEEYIDRYREFTEDSETMADLRERCFSAIAREKGRDPEVGREVAQVYAAERDHANVRLFPGARATLATLAEEYRLAAVTNGSPGMQSTKLAALDVTEYFETVVHAGYDAPAKPDPQPFHDALEVLDTSPERAVHVGNSLASDVAGAHAAGVRSTWLANGDSDPEPEPHYVVESMTDLTSPPWK
jgi:putative hydrolase of the HAD superfamily